MVNCVSCKKESQDCVVFRCPTCGEEICRCSKCRTLSIDYTCSCGFGGP